MLLLYHFFRKNKRVFLLVLQKSPPYGLSGMGKGGVFRFWIVGWVLRLIENVLPDNNHNVGNQEQDLAAPCIRPPQARPFKKASPYGGLF